jgi:hypothetical protein
MTRKNEPTGLERRMFGRPLAEWAKMTPDERLADDKIGDKRIGPLNDAIAAALGTASTTDAAPPADPAAEPPADPEPTVTEPTPVMAPPAPADPEPSVMEPTPPSVMAPAVTAPAVAPSIDAVLALLPSAPEPSGYCTRSPMPTLSPEQSRLQSQIYAILTDKGVVLRSQGQVYAWLLDQVATSIA